MRRGLARLALAMLIGGLACRSAWAHAGPRQTDPVDGATLGDSPAAVRLSFSERPEASLSVIRVVDAGGAAYQIGRPEYAGGDRLSLSVPLRTLDRGVYIVTWRIVSAVDGHATTGAYAFGVREAPTDRAAIPLMGAAVSTFETVARWVFLVGVVELLGAAAAALAAFAVRRTFALAVWGWLLALVGALLLGDAQRRTAAAPLAALLDTSIGLALFWRTAALLSAGAALLVARSPRSRRRRAAWIAVALSVALGIVGHLTAGHAGTGDRWLRLAAIAEQWAHIVAVSIWFGGLTALVIEMAGAPAAETSASIRRFSDVAAISLLTVAATGAMRAVAELSSWQDLSGSSYGRIVALKAALLAAIAGAGAFNRWRAVPLANISLSPLRRMASTELALAAIALAATAALGASPPPASLNAPPGLDVSGVDFGTTVRVHLTSPSDQPGPNRFIVRAVDYDSRAPLPIQRMSLVFTPLDDVGVPPTSLLLTPGPEDSFVGSGANLAFEGRWRINALIEGAGDSVEIPMEVETRSRPQFVSTLRVPGHPPEYTIEVKGAGRVRFSLHPEQAGRSELFITCFDGIYENLPVESIVLTTIGNGLPMRHLPVRRLDRSRFSADVELTPGSNRFAVVARTGDGTRLRATLDVPVR